MVPSVPLSKAETAVHVNRWLSHNAKIRCYDGTIWKLSLCLLKNSLYRLYSSYYNVYVISALTLMSKLNMLYNLKIPEVTCTLASEHFINIVHVICRCVKEMWLLAQRIRKILWHWECMQDARRLCKFVARGITPELADLKPTLAAKTVRENRQEGKNVPRALCTSVPHCMSIRRGHLSHSTLFFRAPSDAIHVGARFMPVIRKFPKQLPHGEQITKRQRWQIVDERRAACLNLITRRLKRKLTRRHRRGKFKKTTDSHWGQNFWGPSQNWAWSKDCFLREWWTGPSVLLTL